MSERRPSFTQVPIEQVREYWDHRPCNIRHSPRPVGTREYFDEVEARKYFVEPHIPQFADFAHWRDKRVLEIGCGIGTDTISFARVGAHVTAVELSERSLALAKRRAHVFGLEDRISFYHGNAEQLTKIVTGEPYDLVYSFGVIHHTPHPERVLDQIAQVTSAGSVIKLMVYHRRSWKVASILLRYGYGRFWRARALIAEHSEAQFGSPVTYAYTRNEFKDLLERTGFWVEEMFVDHIFPYRIEDYVNYRYRKAWQLRVIPSRLFRILERYLGWHLCVTAVPRQDDG